MLDPKGNTAVYLLYAYARICSIIKKSGLIPEDLIKEGKSFGYSDPYEK